MIASRFDQATMTLARPVLSRRVALRRFASAAVAATVGAGSAQRQQSVLAQQDRKLCCIYLSYESYLNAVNGLQQTRTQIAARICPYDDTCPSLGGWDVQGVYVDSCDECPAHP